MFWARQVHLWTKIMFIQLMRYDRLFICHNNSIFDSTTGFLGENLFFVSIDFRVIQWNANAANVDFSFVFLCCCLFQWIGLTWWAFISSWPDKPSDYHLILNQDEWKCCHRFLFCFFIGNIYWLNNMKRINW